MEKDQVLSIAKQYFAHYPQEETLLVTPDGMVFLTANGDDAKNHAQGKHNGVLFTITRAEAEAAVDTSVPDSTWEAKDILSFLKKAGKSFTKDASKEELLAAVAELTKTVQ